MKTRDVVTVIIQKGDQFLFGRKQKDVGPYPNTWHLLGGGVNEKESYEDAVKRELREEANITVRIIKELGIDEDTTTDKHGQPVHYIFHDFLAEYVSGEPAASDDIVELKWFKKTEMTEIYLNEPTKRLFQRIDFTK